MVAVDRHCRRRRAALEGVRRHAIVSSDRDEENPDTAANAARSGHPVEDFTARDLTRFVRLGCRAFWGSADRGDLRPHPTLAVQMAINTSATERGAETSVPAAAPVRRLAPNSLRRVLGACDAAMFAAGWSVAWLVGVPADEGLPAVVGLAVIVATGLVICSARGLYRTDVASIRAVAHTRLMGAAAG